MFITLSNPITHKVNDSISSLNESVLLAFFFFFFSHAVIQTKLHFLQILTKSNEELHRKKDLVQL